MDDAALQNVLASVRSFVRDVVVPREAEIEERAEVPDSIRARCRELGLYGFAIPEEYGGLGLSMEQECRLVFELGYTVPARRLMLGTNNGIAADVLIGGGTEEQKQFWLPRMASGEVTASFALAEPDAGSDPAALSTTALPDGDDWILAGAKRYIANAPIADVLFVFARTDADAPATRAIGTFIVPVGVSGLTIGPRYHRTGRVSTWSADGYLDEVRVPTTSLVGGAAGAQSGYGTAMRCLAHGRIHIAALRVGMAERLVEGQPDVADLAAARSRVLAVARAFDHRAAANTDGADYALSGEIPRQGPGGKDPGQAQPLP